MSSSNDVLFKSNKLPSDLQEMVITKIEEADNCNAITSSNEIGVTVIASYNY